MKFNPARWKFQPGVVIQVIGILGYWVIRKLGDWVIVILSIDKSIILEFKARHSGLPGIRGAIFIFEAQKNEADEDYGDYTNWFHSISLGVFLSERMNTDSLFILTVGKIEWYLQREIDESCIESTQTQK